MGELIFLWRFQLLSNCLKCKSNLQLPLGIGIYGLLMVFYQYLLVVPIIMKFYVTKNSYLEMI